MADTLLVMRKSIAALFMSIAVASGVSACGSPHRTATPQRPATASQTNLVKPACHPAPNQGHIGVCAPHQRLRPGQSFRAFGLPPNNGLIPDVYEGDAVYSWRVAMNSAAGAIVKVWENRQDHAFGSNWEQLKAIGKWHAAYIFMHGDCGQVANAVAAVNAHGGFAQANVGPLILDIETPDASGVSGCAVNQARRLTGRTPIIYTAPGTWPGGDPSGAHEWAAGYGNYSHAPCIWTCNPVGWQYTDGVYGPYPHQIPGIQPGDISVDYGMTRLGGRPPRPDPHRFFSKDWYPFGNGALREYYTVKDWDAWGCHHPLIRAKCKRQQRHLILLANRLITVTSHPRTFGSPFAYHRQFRLYGILYRVNHG